ncbi:MAG: YkuS family protein [Coriobacteriia bacterium]|nr:YkuS family protein [Coriobacteriia bacterium]
MSKQSTFSKDESVGQGEKSNNIWIYVIAAIGITVLLALFLSQNQGGGGGGGGAGSIPTTLTANVELNVPFDAATSPDLQTVSEVREALRQRGFEDVELITFFNLAGEFLDAVVIEGESEEIFPSYSTFFYAENTDTIYVLIINNGRIVVKTPFATEAMPDAFVVLSETDFLTDYDSEENTFEYHVPSDREVILVQVPVINRHLLEALTEEDLEL